MGFIFAIIGVFWIAGLISENGQKKQSREAMDWQMEDMNIQQQHIQDMQQQEIIRQMNDPYMTPGLDAGIDEAHHGIDHGMGIANPEHNFEGMGDSFFGNSDDSFFGGADDSFFGGGCGGDDFF